MRLRLLFCAIVVLLIASLSARADVVTFNVLGTFVDHTTVTGNLVIDTTAGVLESGDLSYLGQDYNVLDDAESYPPANAYLFLLSTSGGMFPYMRFAINGDSLVGFSGGTICSFSDLCLGNTVSDYVIDLQDDLFLESGTVTPASTPEPTSVVLFGTSLLAFAGLVRGRRFR